MKKILYILLFSVVSLGASAQVTKQYYTLSWAFAFPVGDMHKFVSRPGWIGGTFDGQIYFAESWAFGFNFGWNNYQQTTDRKSTIIEPGLVVTANSYHYAHSIPVKAGGYYNFMPDASIQPYAGLGIGFNYMTEHVVVQDIDVYNTNWGFLLSPEVGAYLLFGDSKMWGLKVGCAYNFSTNQFNFFNNDYKLMQNLITTIGVTFTIR